MPCLLFRSTSVLASDDGDLGSTLSRSPTVLDLPFLTPPKHVRFPCPFQSPDLFASTHQTYSQQEYDRTPIDPTGEGSSCALPGRGERCFDADGDGKEIADDAAEDEQDDEDRPNYDDDAIFRTPDEEEEDDHESETSTGTGMFRCWTRSADEQEKEDAEDSEVEEEGETSDDPSAASSPVSLRRSPTMFSTRRRPPTPVPTRRPSSSCSPTTSRRLQWLQTQTESLPSALRDRLLLLASSTDSPAASPTLESPASPIISVASSPPNSFSLFTFARSTTIPAPDSETDDGADEDAEERTLHSSTPRPVSSFPVSYLAERALTSISVPTSSHAPETRSSYFPTTPPSFRSVRHPIEREDSECSSSNTTDELEGYFHSPTCSSASSASDWGMEDVLATGDTTLVESDEGGHPVERWEGLGKDLGLLNSVGGGGGGFRVSRWAEAGRE